MFRMETLERAAAPLLLVALVWGWEVACRTLHISPLIFPAPSAIVQTLWELARSGILARNFVVTLQETLTGFGLAAFFGIFLGGLISEFSLARRTILPYLVALQTVPKIAIAPLLVLWFGFGITSKVIIAAAIAIFPILINTIEGLGATEPARIDMLRSVCGSRWQVFRMVKVPSALPFIFAGLDSAIILSLLGAIVGEFIGAQAGLGNLIISANAKMDAAAVFAILVVLGVTGFTLHFVLVQIQRRIVFWSGSVRSRGE